MIEIHHKADILFPFHQIGEPEWEIKTQRILQSFADLNDDEIASPINIDEIDQLEQRLKTTLPVSLKIFYQTFGIADIGEELQQFDDIGYLKDIWAAAPEYAPEFTSKDVEVLPHLITFSDYLGNGNMFCFHDISKEVYYFDHDDRPYLTKIFDDVDEYLKCCLILLQSDLFGDATPDQVEQWVEDMVIELIGDQKLQKWRY
jgi:hypothetical protein